MKRFSNHSEIRTAYKSKKFDIYYEDEHNSYEVKHLGSTIYCRDSNRNIGMGDINNFNASNFFAVEKPEQTKEDESSDEI